MPLALHYVLWTPPTLLLFLALAAPGRNPFTDVAATLGRLREPGARRVLAVLVVILVGTLLEAALEPWLATLLGYDLTPWVARLEPGVVEWFQRPVPHAALPALTWLYLFGFAASLLLPLFVWGPRGDDVAIERYCRAFLVCALLTTPFYLFVPVAEVAWSGLSEARPLMDAWWPGVSEETRMGSGLDNCFPSLHVGLTVLVWLVARSAGPTGYVRFALGFALATSWVVLALGIHWAADVVAGWVHALVAWGLACAWERRRAAHS